MWVQILGNDPIGQWEGDGVGAMEGSSFILLGSLRFQSPPPSPAGLPFSLPFLHAPMPGGLCSEVRLTHTRLFVMTHPVVRNPRHLTVKGTDTALRSEAER